jgi:hypothetical protein
VCVRYRFMVDAADPCVSLGRTAGAGSRVVAVVEPPERRRDLCANEGSRPRPGEPSSPVLLRTPRSTRRRPRLR